MKEMLLLCTKDAFLIEDEIYEQTGRIVMRMRSPLGAILAGIFMVELQSWK